MSFWNRRDRQLPPPRPGEERAALVEELARQPDPQPRIHAAGVPERPAPVPPSRSVASACGQCGQTVAANDPIARQTWATPPNWPYQERTRSWRYHSACLVTPAATLARLLGEKAGRAHLEVARDWPVPSYQNLPRSGPEDRGRPVAWAHVDKRARQELAARVERRNRELTEPVPHPSGYPCSICGTSHDLVGNWEEHQGRPVCSDCQRMIRSSKISGNLPLTHRARAAAWHLIPPGRVIDPFPLARDMPGYGQLAERERRNPWSYVTDLPLVPPTVEEKLAELEARVAGVA